MSDEYSTEQFKSTQTFDEIVWHLRTNLVLKTNRNHILMAAENSFVGKEAVDFLIVEVPRIVPGKVPTRENMEKFLQVLLDWKIIGDAFPRKPPKTKPFNNARVYVFIKSIDELKKPKPKSRRSASFSGARKSEKIAQTASPAATMHRVPKARITRRLSRSNGNVDKAGSDKEPRGLENPAFDDRKEEETQKTSEKKQRPPKILNRSLESICREESPTEPENQGRKEKVYDWLPFFKSRRFHQKVHQPTRRSVSLDRNHCMVEEEKAAAARNKPKVTTPPINENTNDLVFMHPKGPLPSAPPRYQAHRTSIVGTNPAALSRGRMYESIMRRSSIVPVESVPIIKDCTIWKTELLTRLEMLYDRPIPSEYANVIDGFDIQWNMQELDPIDGFVKSRCPGLQPDYPATIVQFMEYLCRYPFCSSKNSELAQEHNVGRMFGTLVNRLEDLNAPLQTEECDMIISLLSKLDNFAIMLETGPGRRWSKVFISSSASSIEEASLMIDGFSRDVPACGIRASKHRRRAISPFDNRQHLRIQEEKAYKIREKWLIESIQLVLLALPTSRRRKLHKFISFIKSIETNEVFDIADPSNGSSNNREAAIIGLWTGVCGGYRKLPGVLITAVLLANNRALFGVPDEFVERVRSLENQRYEPSENPRYAKIVRGRKVRKQPILEDIPDSPTIFKKHSKDISAEKTKKGLLTRLLGK